MKGGITSGAAKSAKTLAQQVARQVAREPIEVLKQAGQQVAGKEPEASQRGPLQETKPAREGGVDPQLKLKMEAQGQRQLAALEAEIKDIQIRKQQEAAAKAQEERAIAAQSQAEKKELPKVPARPSRRLFGSGQKAQAEKQKTRVEKPLPPSG